MRTDADKVQHLGGICSQLKSWLEDHADSHAVEIMMSRDVAEAIVDGFEAHDRLLQGAHKELRIASRQIAELVHK